MLLDGIQYSVRQILELEILCPGGSDIKSLQFKHSKSSKVSLRCVVQSVRPKVTQKTESSDSWELFCADSMDSADVFKVTVDEKTCAIPSGLLLPGAQVTFPQDCGVHQIQNLLTRRLQCTGDSIQSFLEG